MDRAALVERWPRLLHLAEVGAWPSIQRHGLLSTSAILDRWEVPPAERPAIEAARRPAVVRLHHPVHGEVTIRDNKPITETVLARTLDGMTLPQWYRTLNARAFLWLDRGRLDRLRRTPGYRDRPHVVLSVDTARLLERHGDRAELSPLNSGAVHPGATVRRGVGTFVPLAAYDWDHHRRRNAREPAVELTVPHAVPDLADLVVDVTEI